jgi:predicted deacylase
VTLATVAPLSDSEAATENQTSASDESITSEAADPESNINSSSPENSSPTVNSSMESTETTQTESIDDSPVAIEEVIDPTLQPELTILGRVVAPGTAEIVNWDFESTFVDISAPVPVLVVNGVKAGPTLCLTAAVHGDELNGIEIVRRVVYEIDPKKFSGAVIGVPIVNLQGFKRATRYLPDRRDLNRYFPGHINGSYASRVAASFFNQVILKCDYLVDIHTGSLSRTNLPQIRANLLDPEVASLAEKMGSIVVLQSRGGSGTLRRAATNAGIPAVTLETGAPNNLQKDAVEQGVKTISSALNSLGLSAKSFWQRSAEPVFYRSKWIRARRGGILFSKVELGDNVEKDSVLGLLSNPVTNKTTKIKSPIAGRVIGMALNQVMYPGFAAYHIGLRSSVVEAAQTEDIMPDEMSIDDMSADEMSVDEIVAPESKVAPSTIEPSPEPTPDSNPIEEMELPTADPDRL